VALAVQPELQVTPRRVVQGAVALLPIRVGRTEDSALVGCGGAAPVGLHRGR
jgi:hypothetical protein